jgi:signal transduction histidine kinase
MRSFLAYLVSLVLMSLVNSQVLAKGGSYMGLSICQSIIEDHGGRLWASRIDPQGALFQFTIPVTQPVKS